AGGAPANQHTVGDAAQGLRRREGSRDPSRPRPGRAVAAPDDDLHAGAPLAERSARGATGRRRRRRTGPCAEHARPTSGRVGADLGGRDGRGAIASSHIPAGGTGPARGPGRRAGGGIGMTGAPDELTVVIPVRDQAEFVADALASVLDQAGGPPNIVVIDDGSTDASGDVARRVAPTAAVLRTSGLAPAAARNLGVDSTATP